MLSILATNEIRKEVNRLSQLISAQSEVEAHLTYDLPKGDGTPCIVVDDNGYNYIISERGNEYERRTTIELKEFLYWIFEGITWDMGMAFAVNNPLDGVEQRRVCFKKQLELLRKIDPEFEEKSRKSIEEILMKNPFSDGLPNTID